MSNNNATELYYDDNGILVTLSQFSNRLSVRKEQLLAERMALESLIMKLRGQLESNPSNVSAKLEHGRAYRNLAGVNKLLSKWLYAI